MKDDRCSVSLLIPDDEKVINIFESIRWSDGQCCPKYGLKMLLNMDFVLKILLKRFKGLQRRVSI